MIEFYALVEQCTVKPLEPQVMAGIVRTESSFNPYAIGVVGGSIKQPRNLADAQAAVRRLQAQGKNFSVGLSQVNKINFKTYGLNINNMFDPCTNLRAGSSIFKKCFDRASEHPNYRNNSYDGRLRLAMSCYYSGNFKTGFRVDFKGQPPYVDKVYNRVLGFRKGTQNTDYIDTPHTRLMAQSKPSQSSNNVTIELTNQQPVLLKASNNTKSQATDSESILYAWDVFSDFN